MENHPIPQDVTGFQFKLIGNMTVKQFSYLISGVVMAWVVYISPMPGIIKLPISFIFGFFGFGLAFLPIEGRPMDVMIINFIKALFTPNQYIYQLSNSPQLQTKAMLKPIATTASPANSTPKPPVLQISKKQPEESKKADVISQPTQQIIQQQPQKEQTNYQSILQELQTTRLEKERIEKELLALKQMLAQQKTAPPQIQQPSVKTEPLPAPPIQVTQAIVKKVPAKSLTNAVGLPVSDSPNVLIGIVKNARGNILSNILVEVKDKDNNPVRAFKTNQLGQFASATPLLNGVYTIEFDDPSGKQKFDALELTMTGEIIGPIEATSIDAREELRKALFS
ncbi:MAG: PrgI family protein [Candidatus Levyibacteriota bacterium]|nr:MAG: PrgI family protein [Candidatus Levybacteria bacterium]